MGVERTKTKGKKGQQARGITRLGNKKKSAATANSIELAKQKVPSATPSIMPVDLKPMLATPVDEPFNDTDWQFELKLDGYRSIAYLQNGKVELRSRRNNSFNIKFQDIYNALKEWKIDAVVDGEIVVLDENGRPDFNKIQLWDTKPEGALAYYIFDLLWLDGLNLMDQPLYLRREALMQIMPESGIIRFSDHIDDIGKEFFGVAKQNKLEGIIAKRKDSLYNPDSRTKAWLKIKAEERHEAIICGFTKNKDTDRAFSSLVLGVYEDELLKFIGQVGTGYTELTQNALLKKMRPLMTKECPFDSEPKLGAPTSWLKPFLVCEVKYTELTSEGIMRHASYQGLREDKAAFELDGVKDLAENTEKTQEKDTGSTTLLVQKDKEQQVVSVDGHELKLTNLRKFYWPKEKITKGDMLNYYFSIAPYMMPYMKDRPQSLNRFPDGIIGESFYHKNMAGKVEKWLDTFERFSESTGEPKEFLICSDTSALLYMANLGCIEMNPWHSRIQKPNYPDWSVIDLDPAKNTFEQVIETAQVVHQILKSLGIPSFPKTSGSEGIHIYIPLGAKYNYEQSKQLAELIAILVHEELPNITSIERNPQKRTDKIYIDYLQNRPIQTICAPYSLRPRPGATASAPLHWDEVKKGLKVSKFTIKNMLERVKSEGDLFDGVLGKGIDLNGVLKGLAQLI